MTIKTSAKESTSPEIDERGVERTDAGLRSKDVRAHNRESLEALLAHVDEQCRVRCEEISRRAKTEADRVLQAARDRAAELLHEVRERERRNLDERLRVERARQQSRIRQRELAERHAMADRGLEGVRSALVALWNGGDRARSRWLERALTDAGAVLSSQRWQVRHPEAWSPDAAAGVAARAAPDIEIDWEQDSTLTEGFVVGAGKAWVDATPAGLTARGARIAGVLLAQLPDSDSPESDLSEQGPPAPDKEVTS